LVLYREREHVTVRWSGGYEEIIPVWKLKTVYSKPGSKAADAEHARDGARLKAIKKIRDSYFTSSSLSEVAELVDDALSNPDMIVRMVIGE
jgi:hypothetical protein